MKEVYWLTSYYLLPRIVLEAGDNIEEDDFSNSGRMMNWKEGKIKNSWIIERKSKRASEVVEEAEQDENRKKKKRRIEVVEPLAEVPDVLQRKKGKLKVLKLAQPRTKLSFKRIITK